MPKIILRTEIKAEKNVVFDLSRSIDLHKISTKHTDEEAIAGKTSGLIGLGESVTWKARHFGAYRILTSKITELDFPNYFADQMIEGAFHSFRHEHRFSDTPNGTIMTDVFTYKSPYGILGRFVDAIFLQRYMESLLQKRNEVIREFAETGKWKTLSGFQ